MFKKRSFSLSRGLTIALRRLTRLEIIANLKLVKAVATTVVTMFRDTSVFYNLYLHKLKMSDNKYSPKPYFNVFLLVPYTRLKSIKCRRSVRHV